MASTKRVMALNPIVDVTALKVHAPSFKLRRFFGESPKQQASSAKQLKSQASSHKLQAPSNKPQARQ
jgi:hypothetical protein